uniref:DUF3523 domain-containing protein n=1 Tax=Echinostoma caproni TaxID=27848 RepID=A0A183BDM5_9TREM
LFAYQRSFGYFLVVASQDKPSPQPEPASSSASASPTQPAQSATSSTVAAPTSSGNTSVIENGDPIDSEKPLEERVKYAQQLLEAKRRLEAEEEKKKSIDAEITRRQAGKALQDFKERQRALEIQEAMAQRRKDAAEDRLLRERLRQQIEDDRRAKEERARMMNPQNEASPAQPVGAPLMTAAQMMTTNSTNCDQVGFSSSLSISLSLSLSLSVCARTCMGASV